MGRIDVELHRDTGTDSVDRDVGTTYFRFHGTIHQNKMNPRLIPYKPLNTSRTKNKGFNLHFTETCLALFAVVEVAAAAGPSALLRCFATVLLPVLNKTMKSWCSRWWTSKNEYAKLLRICSVWWTRMAAAPSPSRSLRRVSKSIPRRHFLKLLDSKLKMLGHSSGVWTRTGGFPPGALNQSWTFWGRRG